MSDIERTAEELTPAQEKAIQALLSCRTLEEAAKVSRISAATLRRWRALPGFAAAYRIARFAMLEASTNALRGATGAAVDALLRNLTSGSPSAEIRAADVILTAAYKSAELEELAERIAALEERYEAK